jgi:D-amino-acid dehydrogenase
VTIFDPKEAGTATSFGNAGSLSPSAVLPVGMPGMWKRVPKWLLDPQGPLVIRTQYLPTVLPWLMRFLSHMSEREVTRIAGAMRDLLSPVFEAYEPLLKHANASHLMRKDGCMYVYSSRQSADRWAFGTNLRRDLGVEMRGLEGEELFNLEPELRGRFEFGQFAPENGSTPDPEALVKAIYASCINDGATHLRACVQDFSMTDGMVDAVILNNGERIAVDGVVVASGAWSGPLTRKLGARVPLESQRGYHVTIPNSGIKLNRNVMAVEQNIMVNPMSMGLRIAGTVEFAGLKAAPNPGRAEALLAVGRNVFPKLQTQTYSSWMGHRPCLPDSMPVIGRAPKSDNVWLGFGHGHVGMCAGATTGREIANLVCGRSPTIDLHPFRPDRFRLMRQPKG